MNAIKTFALAATTVATLSLAQSALAQPAQGEATSPQPAGASQSGYGPRGGGHGFGGPMTLADYQARQRDRILRADTDHDGRVSLAEWTAYQAQRREGSGGEGRGGHWGGGGFGGDPTRQFQRMDANHDGYITPAEIDADAAERFARMDANHDGVVTPDERRAMRGGEQTAPPPQ